MTIEITGGEQWQAWRDRILPPVERVRDGLWSIPVPIPDNPLRYVLVYALECRDGLVLIDAGWDDDSSWRMLTEGITSIGYDIKDVRAVLVTHRHADHLGLAERVREASGAWVALHPLDAEPPAPDGPAAAAQQFARKLRGHLELHGVSAADARLTADLIDTSRAVGLARPDVFLEDGEDIRLPGLDLRVIWTPGHSAGHSCFYQPDQRLLFSGDHVLPRITPQVSVSVLDPDADPLADFLDSLARLDQFAVDEVLPAHEYRFRGLDHRLAHMAAHHAQRLTELCGAVGARPGSTAYELSARLTWSRPWDSFDAVSRRFALGETVAHLVRLAGRGDIRHGSGLPRRWYPGSATGELG